MVRFSLRVLLRVRKFGGLGVRVTGSVECATLELLRFTPAVSKDDPTPLDAKVKLEPAANCLASSFSKETLFFRDFKARVGWPFVPSSA